MMKMIGIAISQFANAMTTSNNNNNNVSAVFTPRQAPRFEGLNGEPITHFPLLPLKTTTMKTWTKANPHPKRGDSVPKKDKEGTTPEHILL